MKVVIIGSGNVATVLGRKLFQSGIEVTQVAGRNEEDVRSLAKELNAASCIKLQQINTEADVYVIAVSDSAISTIAEQLSLPGKLVIHTAGSISKGVLTGISERFGVVYPLQSFRKQLTHIPPVPVLIDGSDDQTKLELEQFCRQWASKVQFADDQERLKLHVAAVIVNNFTNHLFTLTDDFCQQEELDFSLLYPLIEETIERIKANKPSLVQTGPAIRNDFITIEKHLSVLSHSHYLKELYRMINSNIIDFYSLQGRK